MVMGVLVLTFCESMAFRKRKGNEELQKFENHTPEMYIVS